MRLRAVAATVVLSIFLASGAVAQTPEATPTVTRSPLIAGNAFDLIPDVEAGELAVAVGAVTSSEYGTLAVIVRNNTEQPVYGVGVVVTARTPDGELFAVSDESSVVPTMIVAGGIGFASPSFGGAEIQGDLAFDYKVSSDDSGRSIYDLAPGLDIVSVKAIDDRIVGEATNSHDQELQYLAIRGVCFDSEGNPRSDFFGMVGASGIQPGETIPFQVNVTPPCDSYLIAIR